MSSGSRSVAVCLVVAALTGVMAASPRVFGDTQSAPAPAVSKTVFFGALDRDGRPVIDLTKTECRVVEDGVERPIVRLETATEPLDLTLVVDTTLSTQSAIAQLRRSLVSFAHAIFEGNRGVTVSVIDVAGAAVRVADRKETAADLDGVLSRTIADRALGAVLLEGISDAAQRLGTSKSLRRAIVVVDVDGVPDESGPMEARRVVERVKESGASVWSVSYMTDAARTIVSMQASSVMTALTGASAGDLGHSQNRDPILNLVTAGTGGLRRTVGTPTAIQPALDQVARVLLGQYALTYERPAGPAPEQLHIAQSRAGVRILSPTTPPR